MAHLIDCMHLGLDRVIGAWEVEPGVIVDPGPTTCAHTLLAGVEAEPRTLLLTHIHLDHAGASGVLARRFPDLKVYVHEVGAPHLIDPARLLASAERLYGDEMERLWGEVAPVPEERIVTLRGGEVVEGMRVEHAPGHASHHVIYQDLASGDAYVGDVAGVRVPPAAFTLAPTPPPEIDVDAWLRSLALLRSLAPPSLRLTHFGEVEDVGDHLARVETWLHEAAACSAGGDADAFAAWHAGFLEDLNPDVSERVRQAAPPEQLWLGLERYWRKRREGAN